MSRVPMRTRGHGSSQCGDRTFFAEYCKSIQIYRIFVVHKLDIRTLNEPNELITTVRKTMKPGWECAVPQ